MEQEDEVVAESQIVERSNTHLTQEENELLKALLRPGASIDAIIPEDPDPKELWKTLDACTKGLDLLTKRALRLRPIIGRILMIFESKPSLYKELGYESFTQFIKKGVYEELGLHRTAGFESLLVARKWPQISSDRYANGIGPKKINLLSKAGVTGKSPNAEMLLQTAEKMKVGEFAQYMEQRGMLAPGEGTGVTITIHSNRSIYSLWKQAVNDGRVHSIVGSKEHDKILEAMLAECYSDWIQQYEDQRAAEREERRKQAYAIENGTET